MIGEELLRYNKQQEYLLCDNETCNLNLQSLENIPWNIGWSRCTLDRIIEEKEIFVQWPEIKIGKKAAEITGFYQGKVDAYGISPQQALDEFEAQIYDPNVIILCHNWLGFDGSILAIHQRNLGKKPDFSYLNRLIDTNCIARAIAHSITPPKDQLDFLAFQYKMSGLRTKGIKTSVKALCDQYGIEYDESVAHQALYDCKLLRQIWLKQIWACEI